MSVSFTLSSRPLPPTSGQSSTRPAVRVAGAWAACAVIRVTEKMPALVPSSRSRSRRVGLPKRSCSLIGTQLIEKPSKSEQGSTGVVPPAMRSSDRSLLDPAHQVSGLPHAGMPNEKVDRDENEQHAVDPDDRGRADERREVAADEAAERHAAAERQHVDAHHAPAHLVRREELDERR